MHTVEYEIRPYQPRDYPEMVANLEEAGLFDIDYEAQDRIDQWAAEHPDNLIVADRQGQVVGSVYLQDSDIIPLISRLVVAQQHRRLGIGGALVRAAQKVAASHGHSFVEVFVHEPLTAGVVEFFNSQGFVPDASYKNMYKSL